MVKFLKAEFSCVQCGKAWLQDASLVFQGVFKHASRDLKKFFRAVSGGIRGRKMLQNVFKDILRALKRIQENIRGLRVHYEASMGFQGRFRVSQRASGRFQGAL